MGKDAEPQPDPVVARLFRNRTGLKPGGSSEQHEVLATYHRRSGERPFAICREGLLLEPEGAARFVPFAEIEDGGYYNLEMLWRAKRATCKGGAEPLSIRLYGGEVIDLPLDVREDGMPDLLHIAKLVHQRSILYRSEERKDAG